MRKYVTVLWMLCFVSTAIAQIKSFNLKLGDKYELNQVSDIVTKQNIMGNTQEITQQITAVDLLEVVAVDGSDYEMKYTTVKRKMVMNIPMAGEQVMDSDGDGPMDGAFKIVVDRSVNFIMDQYGNIKEFKGLEAVREGLRSELNGTPMADQVEELVSAFSEVVMRSTLQALIGIYPENGEKEWDKNFSLEMNALPVKLEVKMWYDNDETILADGKLKITGEIEQMGMAVKTDLEGIQNTIYDLSENGMPSKIQTKQEAEGKMTAQGMDIPMKMTTTSTVIFTKK